MTAKRFNEVKKTAKLLNLSGRELLELPEAMAECNGIGAKWMGFIAKLLTLLFPVFLAPSAVHDMRYFIGGTWQDREYADREFYINADISIRSKYAESHPVRYICMMINRRFYHLLRLGGYAAWGKKGVKNKNVQE